MEPEATPTPKRTLDELAASRTAPKLPAPPVFRRELVKVAPGRGRKAAPELEAAVRANAEAAEEARRVALVQRRALEELADQRLETERQLVAVRREMLEERSEHERLVAQARFRATHDERRRLGASMDGETIVVQPPSSASDPAPASLAMQSLRTHISDRDQLGESHRQRLLEALRERDAARLELQRVSDARSYVERRLERVTEVLHRATSAGGPRPEGSDGVEEQHVRALRDELAVAIARAKSAETRTNELRDEIEGVNNQRVSTSDTLEATRADLDAAREELAGLHALVVGFEAEQRTSGSGADAVQAAEAHARDLEREVVEARSRAVEAEQRVAELQDRTARVAADLALAAAGQADAEARLRRTEGELVNVDGARSDLDAYVDELRAAVLRHEGRVADLEAQLDQAATAHDRHAVDLEATHAATAAELTSASARSEHLATEIDAREQRIAQLEAALSATTAELGASVGRAESLERHLASRGAEIEDLHSCQVVEREERARSDEQLAMLVGAHDLALDAGRDLEAQLGRMADELTQRDSRLEELEAAMTAAFAESSAASARVEDLSASLGQMGKAAGDAEQALATARAERDVAVAQADSLTLEVAQLHGQHESAAARIAELDEVVSAVDAEHDDVVARLDDLLRELGTTRDERDVLRTGEAEMAGEIESIMSALADANARAVELETTRSEDRRLAEQAIASLRTKTESAAARAVVADDAMTALRARELELTAALDAARAEAAASAAAATMEREPEPEPQPEPEPEVGLDPAPERAAAPMPDPRREPASEPVAARVGASDPEPRRPSELRRAVFASLTELAGDG